MLTNIFESRNKTFLNLVKLGDYLGRSLRENVEIFSVDNETVTYLTESGSVIRGTFSKDALNITDIEIQDSKIFEDKKLCSNLADKKISNLLADLLENDLSDAKKSFDGILNLWETKLKFDNIQKKIKLKSERFDETQKILSTPEFSRLVEAKSDLVKMLKENTKFVNLPEVRNTLKLSSVISKSFNLPRITIQSLSEGSFGIPQTINHTLYEHLCKLELVAKELVESKNSLDTIWITNEKIQKLPSFIYESDDNIMKLVAEIISEMPYFAMATKKQINTLVEGNLDLLIEDSTVPTKDIKSFVAKIFEFKKPVKVYFTEVLNEKYGVNVQSLTSTPTFDSLAKTQSVIFNWISSLAPKNSNVGRVLQEFSEIMKVKTGVETIDISDFLMEIFDDCGYSESLNETSLLNYLNFDRVADDLGKIGQVLKMIQAGVAGAGGAGAGMAQAMAQQVPQGEGEYESDGGELAGMGELEGGEEGDMPPEDEEQNPMAKMDAEDAAAEAQGEFDMEGEEGMAPEGEEGMAPEGEEEMAPEGEDGESGDEEVEFSEKDDLVDNLKELEELIATLKGDLDISDEGGDEEVDMGEEGEEGAEEGEEDVHIDIDSHNEEEGEEESEEESGDEGESEDGDMPPKKKKPKPDIE